VNRAPKRGRARLTQAATTLLGALAATGILAGAAGAHAAVSPAVSLAGHLQLYSLAVPTEKDRVRTTKVVLTVPAGFAIDSFAPSPGWRRVLRQTGSGSSATVQKVTWRGGRVPTGEDSLFQFLAEAARPGMLTFHVEQTYSDGSIVDWTGSERSGDPAPTIEVVSSLSPTGGSGGSAGGITVLEIVAITLSVLALLGAGLALAGRGGQGRPLA
jgi:uncharacterized protein YcnI